MQTDKTSDQQPLASTLGAMMEPGGLRARATPVSPDVLRAANKVLENYVASMQRKSWQPEPSSRPTPGI